jgi:hypothetical protein
LKQVSSAGQMPHSKILDNIAAIRTMLHDMERDVGLTDLSPLERDVLYAATTINHTTGQILRSDDLWAHELVRNVPEATFRRALRNLVERGLLQLAPGRQRGAYTLHHPKLGPSA